MQDMNLEKLFNPHSVAMIGASANPRKWGFIILLNILKGNFKGNVYPVNPHEKSILGYPCYASVIDIPVAPDLAIITTPANAVAPLIDECGRKGIGFVVVISSDFSETGPEGAGLEQDVIERAKRHGIRLVGPNSMGIFSARSKLHAQMPPIMPLTGAVSMFSQSGNLGFQMLGWGVEEGVGFSKFVSSGNEGDLSSVDYLRYFAADEDTRVILGYLEGVDSGAELTHTAKAISKNKPIIVLKGGRTDVGGQAVASHTGAMAGASKIWKAALRQAGMIEVHTSQGLLDCAKAFANYPLPKGNRVGIITRGGGWGVITADGCAENRLEVPPLPQNVIRKLDKILPKYWSHRNPVDLVATIAKDPYLECLEILAAWEGIDAILALGAKRLMDSYPYSKEVKEPKPLVDAITLATEMIHQYAQKPDKVLLNLGQLVKEYHKPIIAVSLASEFSHRSFLEDFKVVSYPTPERAVRVLGHMVDYSRYLARNSERNPRS
jgi:acyl-CoA synthetase (NDP forming)